MGYRLDPERQTSDVSVVDVHQSNPATPTDAQKAAIFTQLSHATPLRFTAKNSQQKQSKKNTRQTTTRECAALAVHFTTIFFENRKFFY